MVKKREGIATKYCIFTQSIEPGNNFWWKLRKNTPNFSKKTKNVIFKRPY